jgi:hypothetical protein
VSSLVINKKDIHVFEGNTTNKLIHNGNDGSLEVIGYCDFDWEGDAKGSKPRT